MKILVTSGGTKIPIDRVRDITNMSKGTFGSKIATELLKLNQEVYFLKAKGSRSPFKVEIDLAKGYNDSDIVSWTKTHLEAIEKMKNQRDACIIGRRPTALDQESPATRISPESSPN